MTTTIRYKVFEHHKKEDGSYNVKIRIYHEGREKYIPTNIFALKSELKNFKLKEGTDTFRQVQVLISAYYKNLESVPEGSDIDTVVSYLKSERPQISSLDFYEYANRMIERMRSEGRESTANNYKLMLNSLARFNRNVMIKDITVTFLKNYEHFLRTNTYTIGRSKKQHKTGERGLSLYMGLIRAVMNEAVREFSIMSPFDHGRYRIPKESAPEQRSLSIDTIRKLRDMDIKGGRSEMARDMFMLSFYLMGMNAADLYTCENYADGRITYNRKKTASRRQDRALFSVKVIPGAETIINRYRGANQRVFIFSEQYSTLNNFNRALREGLLQIEKQLGVHLEFYAARHSFASIARNECGIDKYTVHECLNHVDESTRITDQYIRKDWRLLDEANWKVQGFVKGC